MRISPCVRLTFLSTYRKQIQKFKIKRPSALIDDGCPAAGLPAGGGGLLDSFVCSLSYDIAKWAMMGETRPHCTIDHLISNPRGPYWRLDGRDPSDALKDVLLEPWPRCSSRRDNYLTVDGIYTYMYIHSSLLETMQTKN